MFHRSHAIAAAAVAVVLLACTVRAGAEEKPRQERSERYRPAFHFAPERNWMNDPNGLVYADGEWHLFYQYNPEGDTWGHMSWGHAVSKDLATWEHLPVALREENGVMMFSGSAVIDHRNTSGFGKDGRPPMVAIYTGHTPNEQTQHIAYSTDKGRTWTKYAGNPVIDRDMKDFRDPKVFWHEPSGKWVMVVVLPGEHAVAFYGSADLKKWDLLSEFGKNGSTSAVWECPDLFELPILREGKPTGESRWVLAVSTSVNSAPAGGSGVQYFVGQFDGKHFTNDNPKDLALWADHGPDFYAAQSYSDVPKEDGRRIWIGWMTNLRYGGDQPTTPYRGNMTIPREVSLVETPAGVRLSQRWVRELSARAGEFHVSRDVEVKGTTPLDLTGVPALRQPKLNVTFKPSKEAGTFGVKLNYGKPEAGRTLTIAYDSAARKLVVDRTKTGGTFHKDYPGRYTVDLEPRADGTVALDLVIDRSSVETFANDGVAVISTSVFADGPLSGIDLFANGGAASAKVDLTAW